MKTIRAEPFEIDLENLPQPITVHDDGKSVIVRLTAWDMMMCEQFGHMAQVYGFTYSAKHRGYSRQGVQESREVVKLLLETFSMVEPMLFERSRQMRQKQH